MNTKTVMCERICGDTAHAVKILTLEEEPREVWIPWSAVHEIHRDNDPPTIVIDKWLAEKEDL